MSIEPKPAPALEQTEEAQLVELFGRETLQLDRRDFVRILGGGIVVFVTLGGAEAVAQRQRPQRPTDFNAYLRIGADGRVSVFTGKVELGQGVHTSLAQMAAEELRVALDQVDMVMGDTDLCPWDMATVGSMTTRFTGPALRAAAAEAREVLVDLAAEELGVESTALEVDDGAVFVASDPGRSVTYAALADGEAIARTIDRQAVLRSVRQFTVMGTSPRRLDAVDKVTGGALFAGDIRLPGMLYASILTPPSHQARLSSVDASAASRMDGVTVIHEDELLATLHEDPEISARALAAVRADWNVPEPAVDNDNIFDHLVAAATDTREQDARGDLAAGARDATVLFDQTYLDGYVAHAPMEPHTALASLEDGKLTVWSATQGPFSLKDRLVRDLGLTPDKVRVITPYVGGAFGGKTVNDEALDAARLAMITGKPVQVARTRAQEFFYDTFRPAALVKVRSGLDADGRICLWDYGVYYTGARGADQLYDVPNSVIKTHRAPRGAAGQPLRTGAWRAPGASTNVFARESQIDVMAAAARVDPLEFRLRQGSDPRLQRVLRAAAERFGWQPQPAPSGRGVGMAFGTDAGTYVALMAQVKVNESTGAVRVERVVCAQDMGIVVNPTGALMQAEGCITMGLGYALAEDIRFRGGEVLDKNFDTYELPRFSWMPEIDVVLVENNELDPQGGGEPAIICMGAVIANAIFDATGARLLQLPMTPAEVRRAIATDPLIDRAR